MPTKKHIKGYALRHAVTKISQDDFLPGIVPLLNLPNGPGSAIPNLSDLFKNCLLKLPIFTRGKKKGDRNVYLRAPEYSQTVELGERKVQVPKELLHDPEHPETMILRDADILLDGLASILISHFKSIQIDSKVINRERMQAFSHAMAIILSWKEELAASKIVDEKTFKTAVNRIADWIIRYVRNYVDEGFTPNQRTELVRDLYTCFRKAVPKLRKNGVFYCIANILKGFGIEGGTIQQIYGRIKRDYYRKVPGAIQTYFSAL